jgi:hypothetical protein
MGDEIAQVVCVVGRVHDSMTHARQTIDQTACLRAIAPLPGRDRETDRQSKCINRSVDFCRQAAFGYPDTGSFKPPF